MKPAPLNTRALVFPTKNQKASHLKAPLCQAYSRHLAIIGGGVVGTSIAAMCMDMCRDMADQRCDQMRISLIDTAKPGAGLPFRAMSQDPDRAALYLMNQPSERVGYNPCDPLAFSRFLNPLNPQAARQTFAPRVAFGAFMQSEFERVSGANQGAYLTHLPEAIKQIDPTNSGLELKLADSSLVADQAVLAIGHSPGHVFGSLQNTLGFFHIPFDIDALFAHLDGSGGGRREQPVLIIGAGQSCVDGIAVLISAGFKGPIHTVANSPTQFWAYRPCEHPLEADSNPYEFRYWIKSEVGRLCDGDAQLIKCLDREIQHGLSLGVGPMTVLKNAKKLGLHEPLIVQKMSEGIAEHRLELIEQLKESGQLMQHQGWVDESRVGAFSDDLGNFKRDLSQGFRCDLPALADMKFGTVLNGSFFARQSLNHKTSSSPLIQQCLDRKLIEAKPQDEFLTAGQQKGQGLFMAAGPMTSRRWVLEEYRDANAKLAKRLLNPSAS